MVVGLLNLKQRRRDKDGVVGGLLTVNAVIFFFTLLSLRSCLFLNSSFRIGQLPEGRGVGMQLFKQTVHFTVRAVSYSSSGHPSPSCPFANFTSLY